MKKRSLQDVVLDTVLVLVGTFIFAAGLYFFIEPCEIAPGGASGVALIIAYVTDLPLGLLSALINVPLLLIGWKMIGHDFMWKTLLSVGSFTIFYDYILTGFPVYRGEKLISCIFGGVLWGIGIGIVFMRSGSTGGTDILVKIVNQKKPHLQLGKMSFALDVLIILVAMAVFRSIESGLFSMITMFVCTQIIDMMIYGGDQGKLVYVFSEKNELISQRIQDDLNRGITFFSAEGGYSRTPQQVLMCAVRRNEYYQMKRMVHEIDPKAFMIAADAAEVMGEGFKPLDGQN